MPINDPTKSSIDPYAHVPKEDCTRTTILFPNKEYSDIKRVEPKTGVLQTTINILLNELITRLKEHGITEWDPDRYWSAVANCTITLGHGKPRMWDIPPGRPDIIQRRPAAHTAAGSITSQSTEATSGDDRRGNASVAREAVGESSAPDAPSPSPRVGRSTRRSGSKKS